MMRKEVNIFINDNCIGCTRSTSFTNDKKYYCCLNCRVRVRNNIPLNKIKRIWRNIDKSLKVA